ncbi:hypothetical protein DIPPA_09587 [Diplonema papillatum]|nr:hypothetical protein DIPPA_09587 [Diplonema papillatum]
MEAEVRRGAAVGCFMDATVAQEGTCVADAAAFAAPAAARVLPLLVKSVKESTQAGQRAHFSHFLAVVDALDSVPVTLHDAAEFLAVAFLFQKRRWGHTTLQTALNTQVSTLAFRILCRLLGRPHRWHSLFVEALSGMLRQLQADTHFPKPAVRIPRECLYRPYEYPLQLPGLLKDTCREDTSSEVEDVVAEREREAVEQEAVNFGLEPARQRLETLIATAAQAPEDDINYPQHALEDPWLRCLSCLPSHLLGSLSEARFRAIEADFASQADPATNPKAIYRLERLSGSTQGVASLMDVGSTPPWARTAIDVEPSSPLQKSPKATEPSSPSFTAPHHFHAQQGKRRSSAGQAKITLAAALCNLFPDCPVRYIKRRAAGLVVPDASEADACIEAKPGGAAADAAGSETYDGTLLPPDELINAKISAIHALDLRGNGRVTRAAVRENGGVVSNTPFTVPAQWGDAGMPLPEVLRAAFFPGVSVKVLQATLDSHDPPLWVRKRVKRIRAEQLEREAHGDRVQTAREEVAFIESLVAAEACEMAAISDADRPHVNPTNDPQPCAAEENALVPSVLGCEAQPRTLRISGLTLCADDFRIDTFLDDDSHRADAVNMLEHLDLSGVPVAALASHSKRFLQHQLQTPCKVFR